MKAIHKILCLVLVLTLFAAMALGSGSDSGEQKELDDGGNNAVVNKEEITIEEQVLLTWENLTITAKKYETDSIWGDGIKVLIENNGEKDLSISCNALIVNNYMITDLFSATVAAGKKANETIYLSSSDLEAAGIENVGQVEIYFHIYDADSYDTLYDSDCVTIQTSAYDKMDTTPNDMGVELYNKNGIRIVGKYVEEDSFWGTAVLMYIENTSAENVTVSCEDMSINGFMVTPLFYCNIYSNKKAMDTITILQSDLDENGISAVEDIEVKFHIYNSDTYKTIDETDPIAFSTK